MNVNALLGVAMTLASALVDSKAIVAASRAWQSGQLVGAAFASSAAWFFVGFFLYLGALRFLTAAGLTEATLQLPCWFGGTIVGVAIISGDVVHWPVPRLVAAVVAVLALGYVLIDGAQGSAASSPSR